MLPPPLLLPPLLLLLLLPVLRLRGIRFVAYRVSRIAYRDTTRHDTRGPHGDPSTRPLTIFKTTSEASTPGLISVAVNSRSWDTSCIALEPAAS